MCNKSSQPYVYSPVITTNIMKTSSKHNTKTYDTKTAGICRSLSTLYPIRSQLQKIEFATLWIILAHAAIYRSASPLSIMYTKLSFFARAVAYSIDIANAITKYNNSNNHTLVTLPLWLISHHSGVLGMHLFSVFYIAPKTPIEIFVWALASQSSHNTWTKKISLALYWGNVLVGVIAGSVYGCFLYDGGAGYAAWLFVVSVLVTCFGIALLVTGSVMGSHFFVRLETRKNVAVCVEGETNINKDVGASLYPGR